MICCVLYDLNLYDLNLSLAYHYQMIKHLKVKKKTQTQSSAFDKHHDLMKRNKFLLFLFECMRKEKRKCLTTAKV